MSDPTVGSRSGSRPRRICFVIPSLAPGGAERVLSRLANHFADSPGGVRVITFSDPATDFYELAGAVERDSLDAKVRSRSRAPRSLSRLQRLLALRSALRSSRADVIVSFMDRANTATLIATIGTRIPVVVSERVHPPSHGIGALWSALRRITYGQAAAVVVQTERSQQWAEDIVEPRRVFVVPNPVILSNDVSDPASAVRDRTIVGMGRLVEQKGFDVLIGAFARIIRHHPDWSLLLIGDGPDGPLLRRLADRLLPPGSFEFVGITRVPADYLCRAGIFALSSRYEGFPNALLEAMSCGCPVVAADCPSGPREIINDEVDGLLVAPDDIDALSVGLERLITNCELRAELGARAQKAVKRFGAPDVFSQWRAIIDVAVGDVPATETRARAT